MTDLPGLLERVKKAPRPAKYTYRCIADCGEHGWLPDSDCPNCERVISPAWLAWKDALITNPDLARVKV